MANSSGPLQATFVVDGEGMAGAGMVGAYANRDGTVNVVGLWSAPGTSRRGRGRHAARGRGHLGPR